MLTKIKLVLSIIILLFISTAIFGQVADDVVPDSTFIKMQKFAVDFLPLLYNNSYLAEYKIMWEYFVLNGYNYSEDYWDAYDYEEEDYFTEDMMDVISSKLHTNGVADSTFTDWTFDKGVNSVLAKCHSKHKDIEFLITPGYSGTFYVSEINIADIKKE